MKIGKLVLAQAVLCSTLLPLGGIAAAANNYPGLQCIALSGTVHPDSDGHIENTSASAATVLCPIPVDASVSGLSSSGSPLIFVTDQNVSAEVCCSSRVKNTGQSVISGGSLCTSGTNPAAQSLSPINPGTTGGNFTFTHRWLQCDLPALGVSASEVRTYRF